ncbi:TcpE family conjugal transfer membrane protein [Streptosporangium sp. NPDC004379]|uniref:TcpE family conjugal transfer membrane protein n=1 Tax=Streptosporangium sp. NPDC004379 TaxID=3366189 RepID=UPI0036BE4663
MDLPTYTNIWRIEKRLYKLYDLRLPMPLPIVWIGVFVGVAVPWSLLLALLGLPFDAPWHVLYIVPPGVVTWLSTRPVIESKRLTELLQSQTRYMGEPRTWCRMAPVAEPTEITLTGKVWRAAPRRAADVRVKSARKARHTQAGRAASPREVRPAVAAAAAAALEATQDATARGYAAETIGGEQTSRGRAAWGAVRAARRGTAPALGSPAEPAPPLGDPAAPARAEPPAARPPAAAGTAPVRAMSPAAGPADPARAVPAAREAPAAAETRTVFTGKRPAAPEARPAASGGSSAATPPIDTEALRRLRRLAASAEAGRADEAGRVGRAEEVPNPRAGRADGAGRDGEQAPASLERFAERRRTRSPERHAEPLSGHPAEHPSGQPAGHPPEPAEHPAEHPPARPAERPPARSGGVPIRAVPSATGPAADPVAPAVPVPRTTRGDEPVSGAARIRRVESVVGRDSSGGWRRLAQVVVGPGGGGRTDGSEIDEARATAPFPGSRRVVVLGCTGGAGQTTTALMLGHTLARHREDRVLAVDAGVGRHNLSSRVRGESPETLTSLLAGLDTVHGYLGMRAYTSRCASGLEVLAGDSDAGAEQRLADRTLFSDRRLGQAMDTLEQHYKLVVVDPAAALAARVLPYADQLVLVVPASEDGPDAVAMTYEWLDGHGCADLRRRAVLVVNGVSRRSMGDVEQAEAVARGRCRAIVRVPWEDELAPGRSELVEPSHLRTAGRRAYLALAGVVVAGLGTAQTVRSSEEELAK